MSGQRAIKFCRMCFKYNNLCKEIKDMLPEGPDKYESHSGVHLALSVQTRDYATAQAMQAAEKCFANPKGPEALNACLACEYKSPAMAKIFEEEKVTP